MTENGRTLNEAGVPETPETEPQTMGPAPAAEAETPAAEKEAAPPGGDPLAEALQREAELKDRLLRAIADTENLRRRVEKEKQDALQYGNQKFANALLVVVDTLQRALGLVSPEAREGLPEPLRNMIAGLDLTEKELLRVFAQHGIKPVNPKGERFDPHLHQAIAQVPVPSVPDGTVVDVAQVGYTIGDRLLRPAMAVVSTGGGAAAKDAPAASTPGQGVDTSA